MEHWGKGRFQAYSAGSHPTGKVNPFAVEMLAKARLRTDGLRSKAWDEFAAPGAPNLDFVFTVCDQAAGEICPVWPGKPITAHWGIPDPAAVIGSDEQRQRAFREAFRVLENRIKLFASLPVEKLDRLTLTRKVQEQIQIDRSIGDWTGIAGRGVELSDQIERENSKSETAKTSA